MQQDLITVYGHSGLARDKKTGAIININSTDIEKAKLVKNIKRKAAHDNENLQSEVKTLQNEVTDIKILLNKILEKL
jgi:predicted phosphodiesterase